MLALGSEDKNSLPDRISSGVHGLDDILSGGLPSGHLYLVDGDPGTGKTTLGIQFLLGGVQNGESVLYVTLSESKLELQQVALSHGWSLSEIPIIELLPMEETLRAEEQYTVLHPGEVELSKTIKSILQRVEEHRPSRVVFDSLSELRLLARESLRFRRHLLALKQYFAGKCCTVLLLDDRTAYEDERDLQSIVHGVIRLQNLSREYGTKRRRLEIVKLRGVRFREGFHDYNIHTGGLSVYPRLIAGEHRSSFAPGLQASGLAELDTLLGGGLNHGTSTLIMGPAGSGKSTIALRYAVTTAERGDTAYFVTFDETIQTLTERAESLGISIRRELESGRLTVEVIEPADLSPGHFVARIRERVETGKARTVVVDSLNGLLAAMPGEEYFTIQLHELITYLNMSGVVTILTLAQYGILGQGMGSPVDVSYLADSILLLRFFEHAGEVRQAVSVVKKRSGRHERYIRELQLGPEFIKVGEPLVEFHGVLTGLPQFIGRQGQLMLQEVVNESLS